MVATGVVSEGPAHTHDQDEVTGLETDLTNRSLLVVSEPGTRWYLTSDPFDGTFVGQLETGDRFTYPLGHAQARETYRWNGASWDFEETLPAIPAAAELVVAHAATYTAFAAATLGTGVTERSGFSTPGSRSEPGDTVRLRGGIDIAGNPSAGEVLLTLTARDRPVGGSVVHPGVRTGPTGNTSAVLLINTSGHVTLTVAPGNNGYLGLDGITFVRTVA